MMSELIGTEVLVGAGKMTEVMQSVDEQEQEDYGDGDVDYFENE